MNGQEIMILIQGEQLQKAVAPFPAPPPICQWNVFLPPELSGRVCNDRLAAHAIDHCCYHKYTYP